MSDQSQETKYIAFVLYEGLTMLDMIGPLQVLGHISPPYQSVVVAEHTDPMPVDGGLMKYAAPHTFADIPHPHIIIVPGGGLPTVRAMANPALQDYLLKNKDHAEYICSVCTGALILGAAGFLQGRAATTHWGWSMELEALGATYQRRRWVEDGKFITAAGVSAGIDMALYLLAKLKGEAVAKRTQLGIEYDPQPPFGPADYALAEGQGKALKEHDEATINAFKEALAGRPDLFEKLMQ